MRAIIRKTEYLQGVVTVPSSKSEAVRALIFALLSPGESHIHALSESEDVLHAMQACEAMGARIQRIGSSLHLYSQGIPLSPTDEALYTGNSGITTHFILPLLGYRTHPESPISLDCGEQMRARTIDSFLSALRTLGLDIRCLGKANTLPISVKGTLQGGKVKVSGLSSQYLSSLLIALPLAEGHSEITVENLLERPYANLTLAWLKRQGIDMIHSQEPGIDTFMIPGGQRYQPFEYTVPGDFSSASYIMAAAAVCPGEVTLIGLNLQDAQGDKRLIDLLREMGADIHCEKFQITIKGGKKLKGICIDADDIPDLLPTLAVLGTVAEGCTKITHVPHARFKETDRIHAMTEGLRRMGAHIEEQTDGMTVHCSRLIGSNLNGYGDHRTVMALTVAGLLASGETTISGAESINKTYPEFMHHLKQLGAHLEVCND